MPSDDLRRVAVELAAELSDETAAAIFPVLADCANELDSLRAENESWRALDTIRLDLLRQSAAEVQRLQALIDAWAVAVLSWGPVEPMPDALIAAEHALLAAAKQARRPPQDTGHG